ncbi:MAG: hypothetical protein AAFY48_16575 [Bacteroidota bacterium]
MQVFTNSNYSVSFDESLQTLHFGWEDGHSGMSYEDFQEACCNFIGYGFEYQAKHIVIDVRNFQLQLPPEFPAWQRDEHYPRYLKLGIQKVAYIMPEAALAHAKEIPASDGHFALRNFADPAIANRWLLN